MDGCKKVFFHAFIMSRFYILNVFAKLTILKTLLIMQNRAYLKLTSENSNNKFSTFKTL